MKKYIVASLDVWGNEEDGFEVNDLRKIGSVYLKPDASDLVILATLMKEFGGSVSALKRPGGVLTVSNQSDDLSIYIDRKKDGKPMYQLIADE